MLHSFQYNLCWNGENVGIEPHLKEKGGSRHSVEHQLLVNQETKVLRILMILYDSS
jgi:hypothetical protein